MLSYVQVLLASTSYVSGISTIIIASGNTTEAPLNTTNATGSAAGPKEEKFIETTSFGLIMLAVALFTVTIVGSLLYSACQQPEELVSLEDDGPAATAAEITDDRKSQVSVTLGVPQVYAESTRDHHSSHAKHGKKTGKGSKRGSLLGRRRSSARSAISIKHGAEDDEHATGGVKKRILTTEQIQQIKDALTSITQYAGIGQCTHVEHEFGRVHCVVNTETGKSEKIKTNTRRQSYKYDEQHTGILLFETYIEPRNLQIRDGEYFGLNAITEVVDTEKETVEAVAGYEPHDAAEQKDLDQESENSEIYSSQL